MPVRPIQSAVRADAGVGEQMLELASRLYPLNRSLTGADVRETLGIVGEALPLEVTEVPSGTNVYDWTVPPEWNLARATISDRTGRTIVDAASSTLHVVGYSVPIAETLPGADVLEHIHWLPEHPDWIPARTAYYERTWGFCTTATQRDSIDRTAEYDVLIDSSLDEGGSLTYAELVVPGRTEEEILLSTYTCHPSLANDNLSGIVVLAALGRALRGADLRHTYRLLFAPSTIGALAWLSHNEDTLGRIRAGLIVSCVGDRGPLTYKRSRRGDAVVDRAATGVVEAKPGGSVRPFVPWGGDERQFCSPGFDLPVGSLTRTPHGLYPEYHTSADDLSFIGAAELADSLFAVAEILDVLEGDRTLERLDARGEPQLGRRGLYESIGAGLPETVEEARQAMLWILNGADGHTSLLELADRASLPFPVVEDTAVTLETAGLVRERAR